MNMNSAASLSGRAIFAVNHKKAKNLENFPVECELCDIRIRQPNHDVFWNKKSIRTYNTHSHANRILNEHNDVTRIQDASLFNRKTSVEKQLSYQSSSFIYWSLLIYLVVILVSIG